MTDVPPTEQDVPPARKHGQQITAKTIFLGILATIGLHVAAFAALALIAAMGSVADPDAELIVIMPAFFIGVAQLPYMIPAWFVFRRREWQGAALGLLIGGSLTFLGNSACFGYLAVYGIY